ncbi:Type 1 glutamine amidotransferase-like domain-containing protein [Halobacillus sp. A5]|uniref:Type 1 glutamine amidotransferase-like domain-containing protein n=1 Tax=Halobacillus sp. A5 TaxID=2880263 RepID=UPI0020A63C9D|nr:Type 1 glutamine amidotransferase-like domain-containing protein [Halobacillus sp. A5]MCP3027705.1 Type 1 glutamine amidotransferase-like domain-containing protein [Halobacillus sp. A5]
MGNLILSGGGSSNQNFKVYEFMINTIEKKEPILYIPLAGDADFRPHHTSLDFIKNIFEPLGVKEVTMWTDLNHKTLDELKCFSAIYFSGGSTLTLLKTIKDSGFAKVLRQYFNGGGTIFGQSAGAIIFGSDVTHTTKEIDISGYNPLNLIHNYRLWCHYDQIDEELLCEYSKDESTPFIALSDGGAIHVTKSYCQVITKKAYEFKDGKKKDLEFVYNSNDH